MPIKAFKRTEIKFLLNQIQYDAVKSELSDFMILDEYCRNGANYSIQNIYYDTIDNYLIRTSLSKPYFKEKLRLRSYHVPVLLNDIVYLELKRKTGDIVHKRRAAMTLQEAYDFIQFRKHPESKNYLNEQIVKELDFFLSCYRIHPAVCICYKRIAYFWQNDKNFRITFDSDIQTRRKEIYLGNNRYDVPLISKDKYLMEIKISDAVPKRAAELLSDLQIYKTKFSKYGEDYKRYFFK